MQVRRPYDTVAVTEVRAEEKKNERSLSNIRAEDGGRGEEPDQQEKQGLRFVPQSQVLDPPRQRSLSIPQEGCRRETFMNLATFTSLLTEQHPMCGFQQSQTRG